MGNRPTVARSRPESWEQVQVRTEVAHDAALQRSRDLGGEFAKARVRTGNEVVVTPFDGLARR